METRASDQGAAKTYPAVGHHPGKPELRPGWHAPGHIELPRPTYWPAVMALAITFLAWGIITSFLISGVGLLLFVLALAGWIGELRHGH